MNNIIKTLTLFKAGDLLIDNQTLNHRQYCFIYNGTEAGTILTPMLCELEDSDTIVPGSFAFLPYGKNEYLQ